MRRPVMLLVITALLLLTGCGETNGRLAQTATVPPTPMESAAMTPLTAPIGGMSAAAAMQPTVAAAAFHGQGALAIVSAGGLYLLDGDAGTLRTIPAAGPVSHSAWSFDGRWFAYLVRGDAGNGERQLWVVRADGQGAHRALGASIANVLGFSYAPPVEPIPGFAWSPTADLLVVIPRGAQPAMGNGLWLVPAEGAPRELIPAPPQAESVASFAWSPDGTTIAYSTLWPRHNGPLFTIPVAGGIPNELPLPARPTNDLLIVAGWWPDGRGLLFWVDEHGSGSIAADGLDLTSVALTGGTPTILAETLVNPAWVAWSPDGHHLLLVAGGAREVWKGGKALTLCTMPAGICQPLPQPSNTVSLDPAWSPDGARFVFARFAAGSPTRDGTPIVPGFGPEAIAAWQRTAAVWVANADGTGMRAMTPSAGGIGGVTPRWAKDGTHLLAVREDAVWLLDLNGSAPRRIAGPLAGGAGLSGYYGLIDWAAYIAWDRATGPLSSASTALRYS